MRLGTGCLEVAPWWLGCQSLEVAYEVGLVAVSMCQGGICYVCGAIEHEGAKGFLEARKVAHFYRGLSCNGHETAFQLASPDS